MSETNSNVTQASCLNESEALPPLHDLQRFKTRRISRAQIKSAAYNPRKISQAARVKLEEVLVQFGLVDTLIWNERTGNLPGGNTRLSILDALSESPDYSLDVAVVDLDEVQEKALNVALNARGAQGEYDFEKLDSLLGELEGKIDIDLGDLMAAEKELKKLVREPKEKKKERPNVDAAYEIVVKCADENEQRVIFEKLVAEGLNCRVLTL